MALVKCPECGKENVSASAEVCPECGFGVREYYENIHRNEFQGHGSRSVEMPEPPKRENKWLYMLILPCFILLNGILEKESFDIVLSLLFMAFLLFAREHNYKVESDVYNFALNDFEGYRLKTLLLADIAAEKASKTIKCPSCGSSNFTKISTINRALSIALTGLASSKIGKQYECKSCKHKW